MGEDRLKTPDRVDLADHWAIEFNTPRNAKVAFAPGNRLEKSKDVHSLLKEGVYGRVTLPKAKRRTLRIGTTLARLIRLL